MASQPAPDAVFVDYRPRRWLRRAVPAGLAAVLLLAGLGYLFRATADSPEATVEAYFAALAERDLAAALALTAPEVDPDRDVASEAVLGSPDYSPPAEVSVRTVSATDREAVVRLRFLVDDRQYDVEALRLRRSGGLAGAVRSGWLLIDAFGSIELGEVPEQVTVNGQPVAAYDGQGPRFLAALPGGYRLGVPESDPLWQPRAVSVRVAPQRASPVDATLVPRPEVRQGLERQVVRLLDQCAAAAELAPPGCPFGYPASTGAQDVRWRIRSYPQLGVTAGEGTGRPVAVVRTVREGEAVVTGSRRFAGRFEQTVPIPVTGTVTVSGDTVVFRPGW